MWSGCPHTPKPHRIVKCHRMAGFSQIQGPAFRRHHFVCHGGKIRKGLAGTQKPGDGQTKCLRSVGHYPKDRGSLHHVEPNMFHTTKTRGEDYQIHPSPLSNGNVYVPHPSCRWGTESNPMHDQRWISHKIGGSASNRSQEGASRPRTMGAFQTAPLHRGTNEVLQMPAILAPQSHMLQPRVLCNLQRQTRDKCLHKQAQRGTSYNGVMHKLQREPSCMDPKCPERLRLIQTGQRQATTQSRRERAATPRRQTISVTVPSTSGTSRTVSFAETLKGVHKRVPTSKPQREKSSPRQRKATNTAEQPSSPTVEENSHRERKGPAHLVKSTAKAKAKTETKKMVSAQIQTSPVPAPAKETQTPRREGKESVTQTSPVKTPVTKTPATLKEGACNLSGHQLVVMMQTFAIALAMQLNITLQTEQAKHATRTTLNASKFLTKISEDKTRRQNKMSISLDVGMNTSMEIIEH